VAELFRARPEVGHLAGGETGPEIIEYSLDPDAGRL
jgi:hypothetical protein